ncbi:hypothetical protein GKQ38_00785 [Candidatus Nanohaloarchaea archaeon]|nr:hypothetical protein GKQ38_00785 [Candidatus Nanohaloarchaea archaeon]
MVEEQFKKNPVEVVEKNLDEISQDMEDLDKWERELFSSISHEGRVRPSSVEKSMEAGIIGVPMDEEEEKIIENIIETVEESILPKLTTIDNLSERFAVYRNKDSGSLEEFGSLWGKVSSLKSHEFEAYLKSYYDLKQKGETKFVPYDLARIKNDFFEFSKTFKSRYKGRNIGKRDLIRTEDIANMKESISRSANESCLSLYKRKYGQDALPELEKRLTMTDNYNHNEVEEALKDLFWITGMRTIRVGGENRPGSDLDVISFSVVDDFGVAVESTSGNLSEKKVGQLLKHPSKLQRELESKVYPLLVCHDYDDLENLDIGEKEGLRKCAENNVAIWTKETLEEILGRLATGRLRPDGIKDLLEASIPNSGAKGN